MEASPDIAELAKRQLADYDAHHPGLVFERGAEFLTVPQAYALQLEVARLRHERGEALAGYKLGCVSPTIQRQFGLDTVVFGHVFATEIHESGVSLDPSSFDGMAIEGEFALRIAEDISDVDSLRGHPERAIAAAFPVIELHNYVFRAAAPTAQELIANNAIHAGVVVPAEESKVDSLDDLLPEPITVWRNGQELGASTASGVPGGPAASLLALAEQLSRFGIHLKRGQIVLAGSPLPLYRVSPGDRIEVKTAGLGEIQMTVK